MSLGEELLGAWELAEFASRDVGTGQSRQPLGADPRGLLVYTGDGHVSAQLARSDMGEYVAYGGTFDLDEDASTVRHDVTMATMPDLLVAPLIRHVAFDGGRLVLSVTTTDGDGIATESTLVWRRPTQPTVAR